MVHMLQAASQDRGVDNGADALVPFTVAIMQPYFIPYAGYFRLFSASDLFVVYDCVQFPRRGWVHRNRLVTANGRERWLTLPLKKAPRDILIRDLRFPSDVGPRLQQRLHSFPLATTQGAQVQPLLDALRVVKGDPVDYITRLLERIATYLDLPWTVLRSSTLNLPPSLRGQDRIIEIARRVGATRYVNPPGGRELYNAAAFREAKIELRFLSDYPGPNASILTRILREDRDDLAAEIRALAQLA
jgi:hypothetical protein